MILIDSDQRHDWLVQPVNKRLREEWAKLRVESNEEKSRLANLAEGDSFGFLGFDFRLVLSLKGARRPNYQPKLKKRTALLEKLGDVFRRFASQKRTKFAIQPLPTPPSPAEALLLSGAHQMSPNLQSARWV